ncbi:DUF861 domain-containing protein [Mycobacterium hodleri]|uniref:cupin domain-containing protein n=1 Tax=Mycolicibacterium hodleri TaxID=49897 RepID=UPI0021F3497F|nr:cupin domain-containing protein [Mycolicibacterium hodleri]MCV7132711.1 DUF861 domain-containing protein [Mycolicibacterium hodleri]
MKNSPIEICSGPDLELCESAIDPEWIIEGDPVGRSGWWSSSSDGIVDNYVWECTAGRFRWHFCSDETVHIIEGEVEVSGEGISPTWLRAGDAALFRAGTWATWYVPKYVRKHAILRRELPGPIRRQLAYGRRAKRYLGRVIGHSAPRDDVQPSRRL